MMLHGEGSEKCGFPFLPETWVPVQFFGSQLN